MTTACHCRRHLRHRRLEARAKAVYRALGPGHGQAHLDTIAAELNGRPRQTLNWRTPAETLNQYLTSNNALRS